MKPQNISKLCRTLAPCLIVIFGLSNSYATNTHSAKKPTKKATPIVKIKSKSKRRLGVWPPDDLICLIIDCGDDGPAVILPSLSSKK